MCVANLGFVTLHSSWGGKRRFCKRHSPPLGIFWSAKWFVLLANIREIRKKRPLCSLSHGSIRGVFARKDSMSTEKAKKWVVGCGGGALMTFGGFFSCNKNVHLLSKIIDYGKVSTFDSQLCHQSEQPKMLCKIVVSLRQSRKSTKIMAKCLILWC